MTNGYSKRVEHHVAAVALHFMYYNFVKIHHTIRVTPAMAAGVTDRLWDMEDVVRLVEEREAAEIETKRVEKATRNDALDGPSLGHSGGRSRRS